MVIIFFNLGLVLSFILLVSIVFINASTKFVLAILGVTCILFLIKNIIQDLYFALYKYKNNEISFWDEEKEQNIKQAEIKNYPLINLFLNSFHRYLKIEFNKDIPKWIE